MAVAQLSVFIESKVGHLKRVLEVFVENDISVKGYALSDTCLLYTSPSPRD